ncbi:hypothetical protein SDC9_85899 [bioreactor metagenome]|uniref:Uncharacterized protein n=1 Tax=bioreactor metagenome TaxID=1076179 RepID=A0A644ZEH8_9ZZZZ
MYGNDLQWVTGRIAPAVVGGVGNQLGLLHAASGDHATDLVHLGVGASAVAAVRNFRKRLSQC